MKSVKWVIIVVFACLTGCATAGNQIGEVPPGQRTALGQERMQMGGDISVIGGVYRCDLRGNPNP